MTFFNFFAFMANQQNDGLDDERLVLRVRTLSFPARIKNMGFYSHVVLYTAKGYNMVVFQY